MLRALHLQSDRFAVRVQIDIESEGMVVGDDVYVVHPNNAREGGKIISIDKDGVTIEVGKRQIRARRTTATDNPLPTGSGLLTSWIVTEILQFKLTPYRYAGHCPHFTPCLRCHRTPAPSRGAAVFAHVFWQRATPLKTKPCPGLESPWQGCPSRGLEAQRFPASNRP